MAENERPGRGAGENEGEGSRSADRRYREGVQRTVRQGHAEEDAERARRDVEADPEAFRRAEEEGKRHSAGEAPGDVEGKE
jgi:hypothetical protein